MDVEYFFYYSNHEVLIGQITNLLVKVTTKLLKPTK